MSSVIGKKNVVMILTSILILTIFLIYLLIISVPKNAISINYSFLNSKRINALLPEGWAFFTRDPREELIIVYSFEGNKIEEVSLKNTDSNQFMGIRRTNRAIQSKISKIVSGIESKYWYKTTSISSVSHVLDSCNSVSIKTVSPSLCGNYLIEVRERLPWAYYKSEFSKKVSLNTKYVKLEFKCLSKNE